MYPERFVSLREYVPAKNVELLTAPPAPEIGVGPVADSVKSVATALPPLLLITSFSSVRDAASSSFVIVQVADSPNPSVIDASL